MKNTELRLSSRLEGVTESATLKLNAAVQAMKQKGIDVVNLTAGEPDFMVPDPAKEAMIDAVKQNKSKYTAVAGIVELRDAIVQKTNAQQPSVIKATGPWKNSEVVVSNGGKQALFNVFMALLNPGDEVLIPSPYWLSYPEMVKLMGGTSRFIHAPSSQGFKITPIQLEQAITSKTRMIIFNSPSNPTGAMYSKAEFRALAEILIRAQNQGIWVVSDEIYDRIVFGVPFCSFLESAPELRSRTITINGMSKAAAMTGWRIGWSVAPALVTQGVITIQGQSTSGISAPSQWASVAALKITESSFAEQIKTYIRRRDLALDILRKTSKIDVVTPEGAFYLFCGVGHYIKAGEDSFSFAERLLEEAKVAVVPGTPFGEKEFVRLSFATDERSLQEGCERIDRFLR